MAREGGGGVAGVSERGLGDTRGSCREGVGRHTSQEAWAADVSARGHEAAQIPANTDTAYAACRMMHSRCDCCMQFWGVPCVQSHLVLRHGCWAAPGAAAPLVC